MIRYDACIIMLRFEVHRPKYDRNVNHTLNSERATMIWAEDRKTTKNISTDTFVDAVRACSARNATEIAATKAAQRAYARRLFGPINGFEEYRVVLRWLRLQGRPELADDIRLLSKHADELGESDPNPYPRSRLFASLLGVNME